MTGLGVALLIVGVILLLAGLGQQAQNEAFKDAQMVTGEVVDKRKRDLKNGTAYELTVNYNINRIEYSKVIGVKLTAYNKISEGDSFDLKYRTDNPYKAINPDVLDRGKARNVLLVGAVIAGIGTVLLFIGLIT